MIIEHLSDHRESSIQPYTAAFPEVFHKVQTPKVLISDDLSSAAVDIFQDRGVRVDVRLGLGEEQLCEIIADYDGLAVRSATKVTPNVLERAHHLKVIGRAGIGVDNIDVAYATNKGVVVMNTPFGNSITTAEHAIAMMLALARHLPSADRSTRAGKWEKSKFMGVELAGKYLGLIGCGNIGSIVAERAQGLRMRVIAFDPFLDPVRAEDLGVERVELDQLLALADFISLHTPLTDQTRNILSAEALSMTKKGVRIVNCARGGLIDETALFDAILHGHVAGAALDVYAEEPATTSPLFELEQVVVTPHLAASTSDAQEKVAFQLAEQMADYLTTGAVVNALNMASFSAEEAHGLKPYMNLAQQLGSLAGQLTEASPKGVTMTYAGQASALNTKPLTTATLQGLLTPHSTGVNVVNAPLIAGKRDIGVTSIHKKQIEGYQTLISLTVETEHGEFSVAGTLSQGRQPKLVEVYGVPVEAKLGAHMLFIRSEDMPGFVGALGNILGDAGINIATFNLGRTAPGEGAVALVEADQAMADDILDSIRALPHSIECKTLHFS